MSLRRRHREPTREELLAAARKSVADFRRHDARVARYRAGRTPNPPAMTVNQMAAGLAF